MTFGPHDFLGDVKCLTCGLPFDGGNHPAGHTHSDLCREFGCYLEAETTYVPEWFFMYLIRDEDDERTPEDFKAQYPEEA